jgi:flagellar basal-body rod protein FlgG
MNYAYTLGASGVLTAMYRQDVAANNLANISTPGFKPDRAFTIPRQAARQEDRLAALPSNALLEKLGAGVLLAPNRAAHAQGAIEQSRNPLDLAIDGPGFLTVSASTTQSGDALRFTRDGRLTLDAKGRLVTVSGGHAVLDDSGRPITLAPGKGVEIDADGNITQSGQPVARLGFVNVPDVASLTKVGDNLYKAPPGVSASNLPAGGSGPGGGGGRIVQSALEASGADPIKAMMDVQDAANQVGTVVKMMQINDELMGRAINTLGKVAG